MFANILSRSFPLSSSLSKCPRRLINTNRNRVKKKSNFLTRSTILIQEGSSIHELPLIIEKSSDLSAFISTKENLNPEPKVTRKIKKSALASRKRIQIETSEGTAILFSSELSPSQDAKLSDVDLQSMPQRFDPLIENLITDEINSRVGLEALKEIIALEASEAYKTNHRSKKAQSISEEIAPITTSSRERVLNQLMDMIIKSRDNEMILEGLSLLSKDRISLPKNPHKDRLCNEALFRTINKQFSLPQLINLIKLLTPHEDVDNFWIGIKLLENNINEDNLSSLFSILPLFETGKKIVKTILEKKLQTHWWKLTGFQISEILKAPNEDLTIPSSCARKWAFLHINTAGEKELFDFLNSLTKYPVTKNSENSLEKPFVRFMKSRGMQSKDPALIAEIMNYCVKNRIRNSEILKISEEYLKNNLQELPTEFIASLFVPFGFLNWKISQDDNFWKTFEETLETKFLWLETNDVLNILLSLIYMERLPVNFIDRVFTPDFLDKLHEENEAEDVQILRDKLRILDTAMAIECEGYTRRMVDTKCEKDFSMRARIRRVTDLIYEELSLIVGGEDKLSRNVTLGQLHSIDFYKLDILIHSTSVESPIFRYDNDFKTAVIIHLPEHYCRETDNLIGPQKMKIRHLRKLGFGVMTLNYRTVLRHRLYPTELRDYLSDRFRASQEF